MVIPIVVAMDRAYQRGTVSDDEERSPTEVYSSEDELMTNPSGNRSPLDPESFIQALQDAPSHSQTNILPNNCPWKELPHDAKTVLVLFTDHCL